MNAEHELGNKSTKNQVDLNNETNNPEAKINKAAGIELLDGSAEESNVDERNLGPQNGVGEREVDDAGENNKDGSQKEKLLDNDRMDEYSDAPRGDLGAANSVIENIIEGACTEELGTKNSEDGIELSEKGDVVTDTEKQTEDREENSSENDAVREGLDLRDESMKLNDDGCSKREVKSNDGMVNGENKDDNDVEFANAASGMKVGEEEVQEEEARGVEGADVVKADHDVILEEAHNFGEVDSKMDISLEKDHVKSVDDSGMENGENAMSQPPENEWVDILGNGLLKKKVIVKGKGQETRPKPGNEVTMIVNGELMDGKKLEEEKLVFIHDDRELIQAFELAVALMEVGEKSILYTDAKYAYGPFGCDSPKIPKNCSITYTLEIVSVTEGPDKDKMSDEARIAIGDKKRTIGNTLYSRGDYGSAIDCYKRGLKYLDGSANKDVIDMKVKCQNNLSAAQLKVNAYQAALQSCNSVLALQSGNIKAMFRKSKCLEALGKQDEALKCLKEASMIDPNNKMVYNELLRLGKYVKQSRRKESDMYKRMVGGLKKEDEAEKKDDDNSLSFKLMVGTIVVAGLGILAGFIWNRH